MMEDMIHVPVRFVTESLGIAPQTAAREPQRRPISRYADRGRASRSLRGLETRGTAGCCIRSKSSRFHAHAFREGNTRSQMLFFQQVAEQAGWSLDVERFSPKHPTSLREEFIAARFYFQEGARTTGHGDSSLLRIVLAKAIAPLPDNAAEASVEAARDPVVTATKDPAALERLKRQIRARAAELEKTDLTQDETGYGL